MAITQIDPTPSDPLVPAWAQKTWRVSEVGSQNFGVQALDTVTFTSADSGMTVQILSQILAQLSPPPKGASWPWGTLDPGSIAAALLSPNSMAKGQTMWSQAFHIECPYEGDDHKLACFMDEPPSQSSRRTVRNTVARGVVATVAGTLLGTLVGVFADVPLVGSIAGFFAAAATAFLMGTGQNEVSTGPNPIWVATDGTGGRPGAQGPGGNPGQPGPHHPLKAVG
jgi:hypothetical protein